MKTKNDKSILTKINQSSSSSEKNKSNSPFKKRSILLFFLISFLVGIVCVVHFIAPILILQPFKANRNTLQTSEGFELIEVKTREGFNLQGIQLAVPSPRAIIVLLHGIGSSKEVWKDEMKWLATQGISSYAFDNRAQGKSEGRYVTFGAHEKHDLSLIVDYVTKQHTDTPLGVWGFSLGGAIALQNLAIEDRWSFAIIESTFSRLDEVVRAYQKRLSQGYSLNWITNYSLKRAGKIANFNPEDVSPMESAKQITVPVFHGHGSADLNISVQHAHRIHDNLAHPNCELIIIDNAGHGDLHLKGGTAYLEQKIAFLDKVLSL